MLNIIILILIISAFCEYENVFESFFLKASRLTIIITYNNNYSLLFKILFAKETSPCILRLDTVLSKNKY